MERLMNTVADFVRRSPVVEIERISQFKETYGIFLPRADLKPQYIEFVNQIRKISRGGRTVVCLRNGNFALARRI